MTAANDTTAVRAGFELDNASLGRYLRAHIAGFDGPPAVRQAG